MKRNVIKGIKKASKSVNIDQKRKAIGNSTDSRKKHRPTEHKGAKEVEEITEDAGSFSTDSDYERIEVESSSGKRYKIVVPQSYAGSVPRRWRWTAERYRVAELIAMGVPYSQIPDDPGVTIKSRMIIYCWLQHPEFKEHVDGITLETGFANKRERISGLNRLTRMLFDKVVSDLDGIDLTDKSIGAVLTAIQTTAKLIAQEKEEFVEEAKVTQSTNISGSLTTVETKLDELMSTKTESEREALEKEFDEMGNDIIRAMTGNKEDQ